MIRAYGAYELLRYSPSPQVVVADFSPHFDAYNPDTLETPTTANEPVEVSLSQRLSTLVDFHR